MAIQKKVEWRRWNLAEQAVIEGADVESIAGGMPRRLGMLLRVWAALREGDREQMELLCDTRDGLRVDPDLYYLLKIVGEEGSGNPSAMRASAKRSGVSNSPLPTLDLLRMLAVGVDGEVGTRVPSLAKASNDRPVLFGALMGLSPKFKAYRVGDDLWERNSRLLTYWAAAVGIGRREGSLGELAQYIDERALHFDSEFWPKVVLPGSAARGLDDLDSWLGDPLNRTWNRGMTSEVERERQSGRQVRRQLLACLLGAIERVAASGQLIDLPGPLHAAITLAEGLPGLSYHKQLMTLLERLSLNLHWWADSDRGEMVPELWGVLASMDAEERAAALPELVREGVPVAWLRTSQGNTFVNEAVASTAPLEELLELVRSAGKGLANRGLRKALKNTAPWRAALIEAVHEASCNRLAPALGSIRTSLTSIAEGPGLGPNIGMHGEQESPHDLACSVLYRIIVQALDDPQPRHTRKLHQALIDLARALSKGELSVQLEQASKMLHLELKLAELEGQQASAVKDVHVLLGVWLADLPPVGRSNEGVVWFLLYTTQGPEAAQARFRQAGRWLRGAPISQALPHALEWVAGLMPGEGIAMAKIPAGWVDALTAWLLRCDEDLLGEQALNLCRAKRNMAEPLREWSDNCLPESFLTEPWELIDDMADGMIEEEDFGFGPGLETMDFQEMFQKFMDENSNLGGVL